jgi:hypothetical protein
MNISANRIDLAVSITKGFIGIVPGIGSLIGEIIGVTIPNQRIDRLSKFVQILDAKLADVEKKHLMQNSKLRDTLIYLKIAFIKQHVRYMMSDWNK